MVGGLRSPRCVQLGMKSLTSECSELDGLVCNIAQCNHGELHNIRMTVTGVHSLVCIKAALPAAGNVLTVRHVTRVTTLQWQLHLDS